jgi:hypothetical protein
MSITVGAYHRNLEAVTFASAIVTLIASEVNVFFLEFL